MSKGARTLCFSCGHPVGPPPVLHRLPSGQPCAACRDRVLAELPPVLPSGEHRDEPVDLEPAEQASEEDPRDEGYGAGDPDPFA